LTTCKLGHIVLYTELANSTMNAIYSLPNVINNIVAIAKQQIQGVGNNKNEWLSPIGCAMFTVFINLNTNNFPSSRLCLLQYAAAIACVEAVILEPGYENVALKIKWPNDIFYKNNAKIGGILVKSAIMADTLTAQIGIGVNIDNDHPTLCLNSILKELNLEKFTVEKFISKCLNRFEYQIDKLRYGLNLEQFTKNYEQHWIHRY
jgi:biotin--protein ligase